MSFKTFKSFNSWSLALALYGPLTRYVKLRNTHASGILSPQPPVSDPDMHHDTCVTPGSLTSGFVWSQWRGNGPGIPGACATHNYTFLIKGPWELVSQQVLFLFYFWYSTDFYSSCRICMQIYVTSMLIHTTLTMYSSTKAKWHSYV